VIFGENEDGAVSTALAQQGKPLKRFGVFFHIVPHRAEAAVLMR
jgi:hypothetical protein